MQPRTKSTSRKESSCKSCNIVLLARMHAHVHTHAVIWVAVLRRFCLSQIRAKAMKSFSNTLHKQLCTRTSLDCGPVCQTEAISSAFCLVSNNWHLPVESTSRIHVQFTNTDFLGDSDSGSDVSTHTHLCARICHVANLNLRKDFIKIIA